MYHKLENMCSLAAIETKASVGETEELWDTVGRERDEAAPDLPEYIMSEDLPHVRLALRKAKSKSLDDGFWQKIAEEIDGTN